MAVLLDRENHVGAFCIHYVYLGDSCETMFCRRLHVVGGVVASAIVGCVTFDYGAVDKVDKLFDYVGRQVVGVAGFAGRQFYGHTTLCLAAEALIYSHQVFCRDARTKIYDRGFFLRFHDYYMF